MFRNLLAVATVLTLVAGLVGCNTASGLPEGNLVKSKDAVNAVAAFPCEVKIDGQLTEGCWAKRSVAMTDFTKGNSDKPEVPTRVLVGYNKDNLYVAVICLEPDTAKLKVATKGKDAQVWDDDSVEVYVDPTNAKDGDYYGFFVSASGATYDRTRDGNWSGAWTSAAAVVPGTAWVAELEIPFKTLGVTPKPGSKIGLMVARNRRTGARGEGLYLVPCREEAKDTSLYPVLELK
ncbi:MAG: hypothetical protein BIFFINMI_04381 [Phycisphaerae bacterium]|nr:hypothetical protein [Phycisphaerae bacterium]